MINYTLFLQDYIIFAKDEDCENIFKGKLEQIQDNQPDIIIPRPYDIKQL